MIPPLAPGLSKGDEWFFNSLMSNDKLKNKKLTNPGFPAAHPEPVYRCFLPDLTGFTGP